MPKKKSLYLNAMKKTKTAWHIKSKRAMLHKSNIAVEV